MALLLILAPLLAQAPAVRFDENGFYRLLRAQDRFVRELWGCPPSGYPPEIVCVAAAGKFDAKQWSAVFREGAALYR